MVVGLNVIVDIQIAYPVSSHVGEAREDPARAGVRNDAVVLLPLYGILINLEYDISGSVTFRHRQVQHAEPVGVVNLLALLLAHHRRIKAQGTSDRCIRNLTVLSLYPRSNLAYILISSKLQTGQRVLYGHVGQVPIDLIETRLIFLGNEVIKVVLTRNPVGEGEEGSIFRHDVAILRNLMDILGSYSTLGKELRLTLAPR